MSTELDFETVLASTDWSALSHAQGPAGDLPGRLRQIVRGTEPDDAHAMSQLAQDVYAQGWVYDAAPAVARALVAALAAGCLGHLSRDGPLHAQAGAR